MAPRAVALCMTCWSDVECRPRVSPSFRPCSTTATSVSAWTASDRVASRPKSGCSRARSARPDLCNVPIDDMPVPCLLYANVTTLHAIDEETAQEMAGHCQAYTDRHGIQWNAAESFVSRPADHLKTRDIVIAGRVISGDDDLDNTNRLLGAVMKHGRVQHAQQLRDRMAGPESAMIGIATSRDSQVNVVGHCLQTCILTMDVCHRTNEAITVRSVRSFVARRHAMWSVAIPYSEPGVTTVRQRKVKVEQGQQMLVRQGPMESVQQPGPDGHVGSMARRETAVARLGRPPEAPNPAQRRNQLCQGIHSASLSALHLPPPSCGAPY